MSHHRLRSFISKTPIFPNQRPATNYSAFPKRIKDLEIIAGGLEQWFIDQLGEHAQGEYAGIRVRKWLQRGSIDYRKALKELVPDLSDEDLERFRRKAIERSKVQVVEGAKQEVVPEKNVQRVEKSLYF